MKREHFSEHTKSSISIGVVVAFFGLVLSAVYLMFKKPERLSPSVFAEADGDVTALVEEGPMPVFLLPVQDRGGDSFEAKRQAFIEGDATSIEFTEAELNSWLRANFTPADTAPQPTGMVSLKPNVPRVSLHDGYMHIIMDLDLTLFGDDKRGNFTAEGRFTRSGETWSFETSNAAIESARVMGGGVVASTFMDFFKSVFIAAPEYQALLSIWGDVSEVEIKRNSIRLLKG